MGTVKMLEEKKKELKELLKEKLNKDKMETEK